MSRTTSTSPNGRSAAVASAANIEQQIGTVLMRDGEFNGHLSPDELRSVFGTLVVFLVRRQKLGGANLGITCEATNVQVNIVDRQMHVHCAVRILKPISADLEFAYVLENDPNPNNSNLRLKHNRVDVTEHTKVFDLVAKAALAAIDVRRIAETELSDPAELIRSTLPQQLKVHGFHALLSKVKLRLLGDDTLDVFLAC